MCVGAGLEREVYSDSGSADVRGINTVDLDIQWHGRETRKPTRVCGQVD
jgi:hypothetical protein